MITISCLFYVRLLLNSDHLSEIEGETLNLYGSGSLDAFDKNWGIQAAGAVTTVCFQFIDFDDIVKVLSKIRVRFPNVNVSMTLGGNDSHLETLVAQMEIKIQ